MKIQTDRFDLILSPLFFAVITLLLTFSVDSTVLIALISSILHEYGHLLVLLKLGCEIKSVTLSFYGMKILRQGETKLDLKKEITVCLAGVTVNFFLCVLSFLFGFIFESQLLIKIFSVNLILGIFNSLPVFSLDGGRAFLNLLECRFDIIKSEKILRIISFVFLGFITVSGIILFIKNGNFTLLVCCIYILFSYFA